MNFMPSRTAQSLTIGQTNKTALSHSNRSPILSTFIACAALLLILTGCGGLASEPPIIVTAPLPTITPTAPPDLGHPPARVNLANGAAIFTGTQGCFNCHGMTGKGDGPVSSNFACKITDFTQADRSRSITISAWFGLVTNGNNSDQSCLMPPWKGRLNEQQRWDVTSYIYSLHYTSFVLDQGKAIWTANCQSCHGETGAGDGPDAKKSARPVPNFSDPLYLIPHSDTDLWNTVTNGLGAAMPSFKTTLTDDQRWAAVAYARSLTWEGVGASATPVVTPTITPTVVIADGPTVSVSGKVTNGTAGGSVPIGLALTLRVIDLTSGTPRDVGKYDTKTSLDGSFSFGDVPRQNNMVYVVSSQYAGILQTSSPLQLQSGSGPKVDMSFPVYEVTTDLSVISLDYERTFVRPNGQNSLQVLQGVSFHNTGDHIFLTERSIPKGDRVTVEFRLPADAQNVALDQSIAQQWEIDPADGTTILGVIPIIPNTSAGLQLSYTLPFNEIRGITQTTLYPIDELTVFLPDSSGLTIQESAYVATDPLRLQEGTYNTFSYQKPIHTGETYTFTVVSQGQQDAGRRNVLAVVLFTAALLVIGMIGAIWRLNRSGNESPVAIPPSSEKLVRQIADLDEQFEAGGFERAEYEAKRAKLKASLAKELEKQR